MRDFSKTVESRIWSYYDVLYGLRGFFQRSREVDRAEFRKYCETLNLLPRYPGFQALTFVRYVRGGERAAASAQRSSGGCGRRPVPSVPRF